MRMPPLPADSIHARACKLKCEKILTRPSREDETDGPSESVSNQRAMLEDFARQRGVPVAGLYVDDTAILGLKSELQ